MEDLMILRRAAREEDHLLKLNRIGLERDTKEQMKNVAKHVGLKMPKLFG